MIIGIGNDIVSVDRIRRLLDKDQEAFFQRILSEREIKFLSNINANKVAGYVANRFAAKEAFSKAIGTGIGKDVSFKDIEILKTLKGNPYFELSPKIKGFLEGSYGSSVEVHLSMSNEVEYAQAFVVIESCSHLLKRGS